MNPTIGSPGMGVQQRASLTYTSPASMPSTTTPASVGRGRRCEETARVGSTPSARVSSVPASPPRAVTSVSTTCWAEMCPSPTAAYRPSTSPLSRVVATSVSESWLMSRWIGRFFLRMARAMAALPSSMASSRLSLENQERILLRARVEPTKVSQSRLGPAPCALEVKTSTESPFSRRVSSGTRRPLTRAPTVRWPTSVCTA